MKRKKLISTIFILVILIGIATISNAADTYTATGKTSTGATINWSYNLNTDNTVINLKCTNKDDITGNIEIPSTIDEKTVKAIGDSAFNGCTGLTGITIPSSVKTIGGSAFYYCSGLRTVNLNDGLRNIYGSAFRGCSGIKEIKLPNTVTYVGDSAFESCKGLTSVKLSENMTKIDRCMFENCSGLKHIEIPENVTTLEYEAFRGCYNLKSIILKDNISSINIQVFYSCGNLTIYGNKGSYAEEYAIDNNIKFDLISNYGKTNSGNDITAPTVSSIKVISPSAGTYTTGQKITIQVNFSETITATKMPTLKIKFGTGTEREVTNGVLSGSQITYTYTIQSGDKGQLLTSSLSGGDVKDATGNSAKLTCPTISGSAIVANAGAQSSEKNTQNNSSSGQSSNKSTSTGSKNNGTESSSGESSGKNKKETTKNDTTTATKVLPKTGKSFIIIFGIILIIVAGVFGYTKYNKYRDI